MTSETAVATTASISIWKRARTESVAVGIYLLFLFLRWSWRLQEDDFPLAIRERLKEGKPVVVAHFHEDEWALLGAWSKRGAHTLVSLSTDGAAMTRFLTLFGWKVSRGSSSKGGAAGLIGLIRSLRKSTNPLVTIAVDGPKGPRRRAKKGALKLAETLTAPVLVMGAAAKPAYVFKKAWSRAFIPLPFSRVRISYPGFLTPEEVSAALARDEFAEISFKLEELLRGAKVMAKEKL